jgi:2-dehydro-3-deoxyphosphogluconate aldolase/(4S)-4-hydroxy-2-oxoglutarate aldolase
MSTLNDILKHKIIAILRGANPADVLKISEALYNGGIRILEITMNSTDPLRVIEELSTKFGDRMLIGAGIRHGNGKGCGKGRGEVYPFANCRC